MPEHLKVDQVELMENRLHFVGSPLLRGDKKAHSRKMLEEHPMIYREFGSATRNAKEEYVEKMKLPTTKKMELTSNEAVKQAVLAGLGYSIMPLIGIKNELKNGELEIIPMKGLPMTSHWNLVWLTSKKLSPVAAAFLDYVKENKEAVIEQHFKQYDIL